LRGRRLGLAGANGRSRLTQPNFLHAPLVFIDPLQPLKLQLAQVLSHLGGGDNPSEHSQLAQIGAFHGHKTVHKSTGQRAACSREPRTRELLKIPFLPLAAEAFKMRMHAAARGCHVPPA
jgi:hypothetical protein